MTHDIPVHGYTLPILHGYSLGYHQCKLVAEGAVLRGAGGYLDVAGDLMPSIMY